jgi:hypothetical protein
MRRFKSGVLALGATLLFVPHLCAGEPSPRQLRIVGPDTLQRAARNLVHVEGLYDGKTWKSVPPDNFSVKVKGAARFVDDPAAKTMNPFELLCEDVAKAEVTVEIRSADRSVVRKFPVGAAKMTGAFDATINPAVITHRFMGLGGGVLFYDNQFDITAMDDIVDWCFRDVRTSYLHVLIRPDYAKEADLPDWRTVDLAKFDFKSLERPLRIMKKALERNPDLKIYASIYSTPAWMKTNGSTRGKGSLKDGLRYRQLMASYIFAYLKRLHREQIRVEYLGFFNEPDFPHTQEGMYFPDMGVLAQTFHDVAKALDGLIAADADLKKPPVYIFPDVLGPGSITRDPKNNQKLKERIRLLDRVGVWGVHDYFHQAGTYRNERFRELRAFPGIGSKPIWMTEWSQGERHGDLGSAIDYGANMLNALRLGAEAWMVFEWCHPSGNQAGLISTDWGAKAPRERYWRSKAYHVFRQIANTTPAGAKVISMKGLWKGTSQAKGSGIEYVALRDGSKTIIHLMSTEPAGVPFKVNGRGLTEKIVGWRTTPSANMEQLSTGDWKVTRQADAATIGGVVPPYSLLTLVADGTGVKKGP